MTLKSIALIGAAIAALAGPAIAGTNILPGSGATVVGSSLYNGFNEANAAENLINGTSLQTYPDGDTRWVFADGASGDQTLVVTLSSLTSIEQAGFTYSGIDRIPTSFEVLTSTDGTTFTPVAGPSTPAYGSSTPEDMQLSFASTPAKYVEFDFGQNSIGDCAGCGGGSGQGAGIIALSLAVPEPTTWAMLVLGLGAIGFAARRRPLAVAVA
jgi:hypothetical protein